MPANVTAAQLELIRLCHAGLESRVLRVELLKRLQKIIPFDYVYFTATDPGTGLGTNTVVHEPPPAWLMPLYIENEFLHDDFNSFRGMFRRHQPVSILSEATRHELDRSRRYREMLLPMALGDELRAVFFTAADCWGTLCLHRQGAAFSAHEASLIAGIAPHIAEGLRKAFLLATSPSEALPLGAIPHDPGVLILTDDLSVIAATSTAEYWLAELRDSAGGDQRVLPLAVRGVVAGLKATESGRAVDSPPKVRFRARSGHWLVLHASRLSAAVDPRSAAPAQIAVIFEVAKPAEIAPLIMSAYLLTKREAEVTSAVLRGYSTAEIAANLHISPNTVQDHLKAIFAKVEVTSRGELAARLFIQQHAPP